MARTFLLFFLFLTFSAFVMSQDIIYKFDKTEIEANVLEITDDYIKYRSFSQPDGPIRNIRLSDVYMIIYKDGTMEVIKSEQTQEATNYQNKTQGVTTQSAPVFITQSRPPDPYYDQGKHKYFAIALGYGNSYGGLGMRIQGRVGGKVGFGFHAGTGFLPNDINDFAFLFSAGIKFFIYKGLYLDTQIGRFGIERYQYGYHYYSYSYSYLAGPSIMIGGDWIWGAPVGFGFNVAVGGSFNMINPSYFDRWWPAMDFGFVIAF